MIEITINTNPDILPTQKEWRLICTMLTQQQAEIEALKIRELTDEEITDVFRASSDHIKFAREILKKASEK